jgi:hypothetical protein
MAPAVNGKRERVATTAEPSARTKKPKTAAKPRKFDADEAISGGGIKAMARAEAKALALRLARSGQGANEDNWDGLEPPTEEEMTDVLLSLGNAWPTQVRPNVSEKAVQGMCLGMVNAFTGGLTVSLASRRAREVSKLATAFVKATLPKGSKDFKFSSIQINYNYAAKRHVDGNNMGPSFICSLGEHTGGKLWTEDQGEIDCHKQWKSFDGRKLHETRPFQGTRISFILFTHNAFEELTQAVVDELRSLGFTAGGTCRLRDPGNVDESAFDAFFKTHREEHPPPKGKGMLAVECAGYACGRGAAWVSFDTGKPPAKVTPNSKGKSPKVPKEARFGLTGLCETTTTVSETVEVKTFAKNRVGLHVVELVMGESGFLQLVATRRFNLYSNSDTATAAFSKWVQSLSSETIVVITISDTAIKKSSPMEDPIYKALQQLGGATDMDVIGYRNPFVFIGAKGMAPGQAQMLLDKRSQSKTVLRLDARVMSSKKTDAFSVTFSDVKNSSISASKAC